MLVPLGIWRVRGVATVLASGTAISLIALSAGVSPALAEPLTETTLPTETEYVPTEEVITEVPTADEVPPQIVQRLTKCRRRFRRLWRHNCRWSRRRKRRSSPRRRKRRSSPRRPRRR